jgi:hypothetical protein
VALDPFTLTDLTKNQLGWLATRPADYQGFLDQFSDIMDFAGGLGHFADYKRPPDAAVELFWLAAFQLQAAAATLSAAFDFRGAIQSALIGAEISIKAGLWLVVLRKRSTGNTGITSTAQRVISQRKIQRSISTVCCE